MVLPDLVQLNQGAFVQGRSIAHNVLIFQDLIKNYERTSTSPRCAIKIDLSKAYDTVDWWFLEDLLKSLCFPMRFIGWIMTCLKNTSYSLLMNGRVQGSFKDELILFCKGSLSAVRVLKVALEEFSSGTGLHINTIKSHIFFGGVSAVNRQIIAAEIQLTEGTFPLKYPSVSMRPTKWKHEDCDIIIQKIKMRLHTWASRHLSFAGRFNGNRSKIHIASWMKVYLPEAYGGLRFINGSVWNRAILAKYFWAISEKHDVIWVKWINFIYLKDSNFWTYKLPPDTSWLSILKHRFLLWQVVNSQLLTRDNMLRFCVPLDSLLCPVCGFSTESHSHLFFECCLSKKATDLIFAWMGFKAWPNEFAGWTVWLTS
ncbi:uncharacterized protein LOC133799461 [Humulus lupulus]|uniref:uncharacterized protein LOC133799461 n=1 Tax=Humulus lupulus TaxID=3486 RepID=UPI002B4044C0|nr:uncharacterized protein LOC133799461 [Humulus lupulus]